MMSPAVLREGTERSAYLDFVKGIAIVLVELGHCIQYGSGQAVINTASFFEDKLFRLIYSFHMPLFMLVSGYVFFWSVSRRTPGQTAWRQIRGLLIPTVCWTVTYRVYLQITALASGEPLSFAWLEALPTEIWSSHWFFWAVLWCSFLVLAVRMWGQDRLWLHGLFCAGLLFVPNTLITNCFSYVFMYPYFVAGYALNRKGFHGISTKRAWSWAAVLLVIFLLLFPHFSYDAYIYTTRISLTDAAQPIYQLELDLFRWVIGFVGSGLALLLIYGLWRGIRCPWFQRSVCYLGRRTLALYVVSSYLNFELLIPVTAGFPPNYGLNLLEAAVVLLLAVGITWLLERFRWSRIVYLGRGA